MLARSSAQRKRTLTTFAPSGIETSRKRLAPVAKLGRF